MNNDIIFIGFNGDSINGIQHDTTAGDDLDWVKNPLEPIVQGGAPKVSCLKFIH